MWIESSDSQRPPDWRWQNILSLEKHCNKSLDTESVRSQLISDSHFKNALQARLEKLQDLDNLQKCVQNGSSLLTKIYLPETQQVFDAEQLAVNQANHADLWLYQALVLGRAPQTIISQLTGVSAELAKVLNSIFFDVHSRLEDKAFIWRQVIRTDPQMGLSDSVEGLWLECAYLGGYERMLYLRAKGKTRDLYCSNRDLQYEQPVMMDYLAPGKASSDVLRVIMKRMESDSRRTTADLQKLYSTLPGEPPQQVPLFGVREPLKQTALARTHYVIVDDVTGHRQLRKAEVLA